MCFEVFFQILIAAFAVFGLYALLAFVRMTWFVSNKIMVCVDVDTAEAAKELLTYLAESQKVPFARKNGVLVLLRRTYATDEIMEKLRRYRVRFFVVDMENMAE